MAEPKVISVANQKGGVGKIQRSLQFGVGLTIDGKSFVTGRGSPG